MQPRNAPISPQLYGERRYGSAAIVEKQMARSNKVRGQKKDHTSALRDSGIPFVGELSWGMHICLFYDTKQDLLDAAVAYFKAGLENNEFCVWATSEPILTADAIEILRHGVANFDQHVAAGRIEFLTGEDWYLEG